MRLLKRISLLSLISIACIGAASCDVESLNKDKASINLNVDLNNKIELKTLYPNSGMSNSDFAESRTTKYFEDLTGYKVTYEQALSDQSGIVQNILGGALPYHMLKLESGTYMQYVSQGDFVDLKPALEKFGKNILANVPQEAWDAVTQDGKIYAIPEIGFGQMIGSGLVWNMKQLKEVGITKVPETFSEVHDAFYALKEHFGATNEQYRSFAMQAAQAYVEPLAAAFDLNKDFYENEEGKVTHVMYHENYLPYMKWLNQLQRDGVLSKEWEGFTGADIVQNFARGNLGCGYIPYWNINNLVSSLATSNEFASEEEARESIGWTLHVRGDGSHGTVVQEKAKSLYYQSIGYYICIPKHMAEYGAYVIDWIDQRITDEAFEGYRLGDEGVHYNVVDADTEGAIKVNVAGADKYIKLTKAYNKDILPTSMYQTAVNPKVAKELWKISEISYNCWVILVDTDFDNIVTNAMAMTPYIEGWSEIDIISRSWVLTYEQKLINAKDDAKFDSVYASLSDIWVRKYWTEEVSNNVQTWYDNKTK